MIQLNSIKYKHTLTALTGPSGILNYEQLNSKQLEYITKGHLATHMNGFYSFIL